MVLSKVDENFGSRPSRDVLSREVDVLDSFAPNESHTVFRFQFGVQEGCFVKLMLIFRVYTEILRISVHYRSKVV